MNCLSAFIPDHCLGDPASGLGNVLFLSLPYTWKALKSLKTNPPSILCRKRAVQFKRCSGLCPEVPFSRGNWFQPINFLKRTSYTKSGRSEKDFENSLHMLKDRPDPAKKVSHHHWT
jgi:hypothetical protein